MKYLQSILIILFLFNLPINCFAFDHLVYPESDQSTESKAKSNTNVEFKPFKLVNPKKENVKKYTIGLKKKQAKRNPYKINNVNNGTIAISFGIISFVLGLVVLWYLSILFGVLLMLLGAILLIVGLAQSMKSKIVNTSNNSENNNYSNNQRSSQPIYKDVVYLKNGSVIKGTITEQIINVSIKIETGDGSIFFYKMEEIEKVAKEIIR